MFVFSPIKIKNWNAFDDDHDGRVSIQEFLTAIAIMSSGKRKKKKERFLFFYFILFLFLFLFLFCFLICLCSFLKGSQDQKLKFVFQMYDTDKNGTLDKEEVLQIFKVSTSLKGE